MKKIESFNVNHLELLPGIYLSRTDVVKDQKIQTYDIRITRPNFEPVLNTAEIHTIEHLGATFLRNHDKIKERVIYFGPMGCRTGFYLILVGEDDYESLKQLILDLFKFMAEYDEVIPGLSAHDCGNYLDHNLPMAQYVSQKFYNYLELSEVNHFNYKK